MRNIHKTFLLLITLFFMGACEDALQKFPLDEPSDETFFSNQTELELAINGAYRDLYWWSGRQPLPILLDNASDLGFLRGDFNGLKAYSIGAHSSETDVFEYTWDNMYSGIGRCNNLLKNMERAKEEVSEDFYNQVQAEAYFLRAYFYSWLIELYSDVPFVTTLPPTISEAKVPRTPKAEIVSALFSDLDFAIKVLPEQWGGSNDGRATKGAALTLKARIALYNEQYDIAAQAAKQVMDLGVYALYPDYADLFTYAGERSEEIIFDMPFQYGVIETAVPRGQGLRSTNGYSWLVPSQFLVDSYECVDGLPIDESPLYDPSQPFENRDPRLDASIVRPQSVFDTYVFETHPDSIETTRFVDGVATRVPNEEVLSPYGTFTGYLWRKYSSEEDTPEDNTSSSLNFILMRYAEVLLIYTEAKIELGEIDNTVLNAINQVRARAYGVDVSGTTEYPAITTTNQAELREIVRRERKVELADEGFRMIDVHRWGIAEHVMPGSLVGRPKGAYSEMTFVPEIDEYGHPHYSGAGDLYRAVEQRVFVPNKDYLWPIPQKDMDVNPELVQNPNY